MIVFSSAIAAWLAVAKQRTAWAARCIALAMFAGNVVYQLRVPVTGDHRGVISQNRAPSYRATR